MNGAFLCLLIQASACTQGADGSWELKDKAPAMATTNPPDVLEMVTGTWGTDADQDSTLSNSGESSVQLKSTAVATKLQHRNVTMVEGSTAYRCRWVAQESSITSGGFAIKITQYAKNKTSWLGQTTVFNGELSSVDAWTKQEFEFQTVPGARWVRMSVEKNAAAAYSVNLDYFAMWRAASSFESWRSAAFSIPATSWYKLPMDIQQYDFGEIYELGFTRFKAPYDGIWHFDARAAFTTLTAGKDVAIGLYVVTSTGTYTYMGQSQYVVNAFDVSRSISKDLKLLSGDTVEVSIYNGDSSTRNILTGHHRTYFSGHEIR